MKLAPQFKSLTLPHRPMRKVDLTSPQMALILALESILQAAGLWLVCQHCAIERGTYSHLLAQNQASDPVWRLDCPCTDRRFLRASLEHTMSPSGDLFMLLDSMLAGTGLAVRCPNKRTSCLTTPLTVMPQEDGMLVRCQCYQADILAGRYKFTKKQPRVA